jgi:hypothetical protein
MTEPIEFLFDFVTQPCFWVSNEKILEPLMRFAHGDVGTISIDPKAITDLRSGAERHRRDDRSA